MQILILSSRFDPKSRQTALPLHQQLAAQFVKSGNDVRMIIPGDFQLETMQTPLAQRLTPLSVTSNGNSYTYTRFDTRTNSGMDLHILKSQNDQPGMYDGDAMGHAVLELLAGGEFAPEIVISANCDVSIEGRLRDCPQKIASFSADALLPSVAPSDDALNGFDRILIHGPALANQLTQAKPKSPLAKRIISGGVEVLPLCGDASQTSAEHKASAKSSLQTSLGLPVQNDIPLFYLNMPMAECVDVLPEMLTQQIQIVCKCETAAVEELVETYPDRFCVVPTDVNDNVVVNAVDLHILPNRSEAIAATLKAGTIPVVPEKGNASIIPLSPDLQSGNGLLYAEGAMIEAVGKALGIFCNATELSQLRQRLAHSVASLEHCANQYLQTASDETERETA